MAHIRAVINPTAWTSKEIERYIRQLNYLPRELDYMTDSQDIAALQEYFGGTANLSRVTAAFVLVGQGDYTHVWITESSRPYDINAVYNRIALTDRPRVLLQKVRINRGGYADNGQYFGVNHGQGEVYRYSTNEGESWRYFRAQDRMSAKSYVRNDDLFAEFYN